MAHHHWPRSIPSTWALRRAQASGTRETCRTEAGTEKGPRLQDEGRWIRGPMSRPAVGGSRRAWGSRRCRLAGRIRNFTVAFAQTIGALAPRPRGTGAGDSRAGCQRIRECRDAGAGRERARSHCEVGGQAARQQATRLRRRGTGRESTCRRSGAAHHLKRVQGPTYPRRY